MSERAMRARLASHERWAGTPDRTAATAPARQAFMDKFARDIRDKHPGLPEDQVAAMAESARKAYYLRLSIKSAEARKARARAGQLDREIQAELAEATDAA